MRLQIHRANYGVDPDGQWWQNVQGEWIAIPRPGWSRKSKPKDKVVSLDEVRMAEPEGFVRKTSEMQLVTCYKVTAKTVPDFEAEVLCRNGWTTEVPIFACKIDESAGMEQLSIDTA